jgi:protein-disulfide isomerase
MRPFYLVLALVAVLGTGGLGFALLRSDGGLPFLRAEWDPTEVARLGDRAIGSENAPLTVVEFADFQCGACGFYAQQEVPKIKSELVEQGLVRYVFLDFPLDSHEHAMLAARAGRCANDQGAFWQYHDQMYAGQKEWVFEADPAAKLVEYAGSLGMDRDTFRGCLTSGRHDEAIAASRELGRSIGVRATPSVVANGELLGWVPSAEDLRKLAVEARDARATAGGDAE